MYCSSSVFQVFIAKKNNCEIVSRTIIPFVNLYFTKKLGILLGATGTVRLQDE